ncbi:MAG: NADH-quinone oxidoreductase subunit I [Spirochaetota bacterium]
MIRHITTVILDFWSMLVGLSITFQQMLKPAITVQYPRKSIPMSKNFRGRIALTWDNEKLEPKCTVCMLCEKACPSKCIALTGVKAENRPGRTLATYHLDFTQCSLCGLCVESCKFDALVFSDEYNKASTNKADFQYDLLERVRKGRS